MKPIIKTYYYYHETIRIVWPELLEAAALKQEADKSSRTGRMSCRD